MILDLSQLRARSLFAARLKAARLSAGLTQQALGKLAGIGEDVASTRINRYERAVHDCDLETAQKLADTLGIALASLYAADANVAQAINTFSRLTLEDQVVVLEYMNGRPSRRRA